MHQTKFMSRNLRNISRTCGNNPGLAIQCTSFLNLQMLTENICNILFHIKILVAKLGQLTLQRVPIYSAITREKNQMVEMTAETR